MKILAIYEYRGYHINVYEDGSCDITNVWNGELVDGDFHNNKSAEDYLRELDNE